MLPLVKGSSHNCYSVPSDSTRCLQELLKKQQAFYTTAGSYLKFYHSFICILLRTGFLLSCAMHTIVISITAMNYFKTRHLLGATQILADSFNPWWEIWMNLAIYICSRMNIKNIKAKREIPSFLKSMWNCDYTSESCWPPYVNVPPNINDRCFQIFVQIQWISQKLSHRDSWKQFLRSNLTFYRGLTPGQISCIKMQVEISTELL